MAAAVAAAVQQVLGTAPEPSAPLMEAGLDSLGAVELRNALSTAFASELPATVTLDYPSVAALSTYIASLQPPAEQLAIEGDADPAAAPRRAPRATAPAQASTWSCPAHLARERIRICTAWGAQDRQGQAAVSRLLRCFLSALSQAQIRCRITLKCTTRTGY